jgi:hypothetical protein
LVGYLVYWAVFLVIGLVLLLGVDWYGAEFVGSELYWRAHAAGWACSVAAGSRALM